MRAKDRESMGKKGKREHKKLQKKIEVIKACNDAKSAIEIYVSALTVGKATYEQAIKIYNTTQKLCSLNKRYKMILPKKNRRSV